jgi:hypothetical protein
MFEFLFLFGVPCIPLLLGSVRPARGRRECIPASPVEKRLNGTLERSEVRLREQLPYATLRRYDSLVTVATL